MVKSGGWLEWLGRRGGGAADAKLISIPVDRIDVSPYQPRSTIDQRELEELAASLRSVGVLQPVVVRPRGDRYELIMGERRWRAAQAAGLTEIPAVVRDWSDGDAAMAALIENLQRSDLSFWDEAAGYARILEEFGMTQEELAAALGRSQSAVSNKLRLLRLPEEVRRRAQSAGLVERQARALLRLPAEEDQLEALAEIVARDMSATETEAWVAERLEAIRRSAEPGAAAGANDVAPAPGGDGAARAERRLRRRKSLPVIRDVRILINTFRQGVDALRKAGLDADLRMEEQQDHIEVTIRIPRQ